MQDKEKDRAAEGANQPPDARESGEGNVLRVNDRRRFDPSGNPRNVEPMSQSKAGDANTSSASAQRTANEAEPGRQDEGNEALRRELEAARKRVDELARAFQTLSNDREEFKQRLSRERERMLEIEKGNIAQILLEVLDELDLSLQAADNSPLKQGVQLIRDGILNKLQALGVERVDPLGQPFDPNLAEAADVEITTDPANDQKVVGVMRAGYRMKDRVIRPARAKVARYVEPAHA